MEIKKLFFVLLVLCMMFSIMPTVSFADSNEDDLVFKIDTTVEATDEIRAKIASSMPEVLTEAKKIDSVMPSAAVPNAYSSIYDAAAYLRSQMVKRNGTITVPWSMPSYDQTQANQVLNTIVVLAFIHTGIGNEGDYLLWHWYSWGANYSYSGGVLYYTINFTYHTTAAQEAAMNTEVPKVLSSLDLNGKSDYQKYKAIYKYITDNISYDHANLNDQSYMLKYTAYAALINKTAVCQGYSSLLYRMLLESNIDCRVITGYAYDNPDYGHAWNIVKIGDLYYNVDSTWDAGRYSWAYSLRCNENFPSHTRNEQYNTDEFNAVYPMSPIDYEEYINYPVYIDRYGNTIFYFNLSEALAFSSKGDDVYMRKDNEGEGVKVPSVSDLSVHLADLTYTVTQGSIILSSGSEMTIEGGTITKGTAHSGALISTSGELTLTAANIEGPVLYSGGSLYIDGGTVDSITLPSDFSKLADVTRTEDASVGSIPSGYHWEKNGDLYFLKKDPGDDVTVYNYGGRDVTYTVNGKKVTVSSADPCKAAYISGGKLVEIAAVKNADGTYTFEAPNLNDEVVLTVLGDTNLDGKLSNADATKLKAAVKGMSILDRVQNFASDVNGDGRLSNADSTKLKAVIKGMTSLDWKTN